MKTPPIRRQGSRPKPSGPISINEVYTLDQFLERVGWRRAAFTTAVRDGLKIARAGGRVFVLGAWFREFLERGAEEAGAGR
jgi:hypothetical protein